MNEEVKIIDTDQFEISSPVIYSVVELKEQLNRCDEQIADALDKKSKIIVIWDEKIGELTATKTDLETKLVKAATAGMESATITPVLQAEPIA